MNAMTDNSKSEVFAMDVLLTTKSSKRIKGNSAVGFQIDRLKQDHYFCHPFKEMLYLYPSVTTAQGENIAAPARFHHNAANIPGLRVKRCGA